MCLKHGLQICHLQCAEISLTQKADIFISYFPSLATPSLSNSIPPALLFSYPKVQCIFYHLP